MYGMALVNHNIDKTGIVYVCILSMCISVLVVCGYFLQFPSLYRFSPDGPATNIVTALIMLMIAGTLLSFIYRKRSLVLTLLFMCSFMLVFKLINYYFPLSYFVNIDNKIALFNQIYGDSKSNKMGINTIWMLLFLVLAVWSSLYKFFGVSKLFAWFSITISLVSTLGYLFEIRFLFGSMAPATTLGGFLLSIICLSLNHNYRIADFLRSITINRYLYNVQYKVMGMAIIGFIAFVSIFSNILSLVNILSILSLTLLSVLGLQIFSSSFLFSKFESKRKRIEDDLIYAAQYDPLTGLYNRTGFSIEAEKAIQRQARNGGNICIFMIDIDYFKNFNDTYGHDIGDKVLRAVAVAIEKTVRVTDVVGRYGGEEFSLLLPNTSWEDGLYVAEKIRSRIEQLGLTPIEESIKGISVSIGCSTIDINSPCLETSLKWADIALYEAKNAGRNLVRGDVGPTSIQAKITREQQTKQ